ncbi:MAG TPA: AMIN domain-containing protein [Firmicutes bacterium]|nr:AMIN domain-containing protein [Bacillota bacterium]
MYWPVVRNSIFFALALFILVINICVCGAAPTGGEEAGSEMLAKVVEVSWEFREGEVVLTFSSPRPYPYLVWKTANPPRLVIDITSKPQATAAAAGFVGPYEERRTRDPLVHGIREGSIAEGGLRVVVDLVYAVPEWSVREWREWRETGDGRVGLQVIIPRRFVAGQEVGVGRAVRFGIQRRGENFGQVTVNYLAVHLADPEVRLELVLARDAIAGLETVSSMAVRHQALAAVNAGFFHYTGQPLGLVVNSGLPVSMSIYDRSAFVLMKDGSCDIYRAALKLYLITADGRRLALNGLNRQRGAGEAVAYNQAYGTATPAGRSIRELVIEGDRVVAIGTGGTPLVPGRWVIAFDSDRLPGGAASVGAPGRVEWELFLPEEQLTLPGKEVLLALGGGPRLVASGRVAVNAEEERFQADVAKGRAPRTALGLTATGHLLLVTINGRQTGLTEGMTLAEAAALLMELGATEALNLDGGGSTTMVVRDRVVNMPSADERPVASALLVFSTEF